MKVCWWVCDSEVVEWLKRKAGDSVGDLKFLFSIFRFFNFSTHIFLLHRSERHNAQEHML